MSLRKWYSQEQENTSLQAPFKSHGHLEHKSAYEFTENMYRC